MTAPVIDLNADVGERPGPEGIAADAAIIAARVERQMSPVAFMPATPPRCAPSAPRRSLRHKRIGAHVSYMDREGFGRRDLEVDPQTLRQQIVQQISALRIEAGLEHGRVGYVKPHGALYNRAAVDRVYADAVVSAIAPSTGT